MATPPQPLSNVIPSWGSHSPLDSLTQDGIEDIVHREESSCGDQQKLVNSAHARRTLRLSMDDVQSSADPQLRRLTRLTHEIQALEDQSQDLPQENSLSEGGPNGPKGESTSAADGHPRPHLSSANHPQATLIGSNTKRPFTAKRTNRPERPLPSSLAINRPSKDAYKASWDGEPGSTAGPEPARIVSGIARISTGSTTPSASTGFTPASRPTSNQKSGTVPFHERPLQNLYEKSLKMKHGEGQLSHTSTPQFQGYKRQHEESTPGTLQFSQGHTQNGGATLSLSEATPAERPAKKARHSETESKSTTHTPLSGVIANLGKPTTVRLPPSTELPDSPRTIANTDPTPGPQTGLRIFDTKDPDDDHNANDDYDDDYDDDTPLMDRLGRRQDCNGHDKGSHSSAEDIAIMESSPKAQSDKGRNISRNPNQTELGDEANDTTNMVENTDEWKYNVFTLPSGQSLLTGGALMPRNYQRHHDPTFSWVCPVRTCRTLFKKLWGLGAHFSKAHRGCDLNDNLDGTLSVISRREGKGILQPKIISKTPLDPSSEPPMLEPQPPPLIARKLLLAASAAGVRGEVSLEETHAIDTLVSRASQKSQAEEALNASAIPLPDAEFTPDPDQAKLWDYIHARLKETPKYPIPQFGYVPDLLRLPRLREVEFNPDAPFPYHEKKAQDISSMILQVTGAKAPSACSRCRAGKGIFKGCYIIPPDAPLHLRQSIRCCGNCVYKLRYGECDLRKWHLKTYPELREKHHPPGVQELQPGRRSERIVLQESREAVSPHRYELKRRSFDTGADDASPSPAKTKERDRRDYASSTRQERVRRGDTVSNINGSPLDPTKMLELETWEVAPGRIRNEGSRIIENIAFSNSYLSQNHAVRISRDVSFQVITIKPGTAHNFEAIPGKLRLCSVASGKTKVSVAGQEFDMGPHGMFKVSPGMAATAMNMLYIDVTVYVSVIPGDL